MSIDTLRSDHLPAYGYTRGSTPTIDNFRRDAILFLNAFSQVPLTLPSHATIMTGLLPASHGVRDNVGYVLSPLTPTLATLLAKHGWKTGAAVSAYVLRKSTGIRQGFDFFDDDIETPSTSDPTAAERGGDLTCAALARWVSATPGDAIFGFLHIYEPHAPYNPPPQFASGREPYDGEISYADAIFGHFLQTLRSRGLYDRSLIILLSDHGESLGEHGEDEHGVFVYRSAIQVPLLVKLPNHARYGETVAAPVGLTDVAPTVLHCVGIETPRMDGLDLLTVKSRATSRHIYSESYYPRLHLGWSELESLIAADVHFINAPRAELYLWPNDRRELRNVLDEQRRVGASMRAVLQASRRPLQPPTTVDPEDQKKLAALGYVASTRETGQTLPDPKDEIGSLHTFKIALADFTRGDDSACQRTLRELTRSKPMFLDAWGLLAQSERRSGNNTAAIQALKTVMKSFPNDSHIALALADALWASGDRRAARAHALIAISDEPALAHEMLAQFALQEHDLETARNEVERALAAAPTRSYTLLLAATIAEQSHDFDSEISLLDRAIASIHSRAATAPEGVQQKRGDALLQLQRVQDAEAAYRAETETHPTNRAAWGSLAMTIAAQQRRGEAEALLRIALKKNPDSRMFQIAEDCARVINDPTFLADLHRSR